MREKAIVAVHRIVDVDWLYAEFGLSLECAFEDLKGNY